MCGARLKRKLESKGMNSHMPVLNICENVLWEKRLDSPVEPVCVVLGTEVHSPCQVLPVANASTVYNRWRRWTVLSTAGTGELVDAHQEVQHSMDQTESWRTICMTKDNLILNRCLVALEHKAMDELKASEVDSAKELTLLDLDCMAHSCVHT